MLLPFIYNCDESIRVYEQSKTFLNEEGYNDQIQWAAMAYHAIENVIPQTSVNLWSGHFFPCSESWDEIQVSFNLCLFGFYKQAMVSLRSGFELGMLSVYWNINDDGHKTIRDWFNSEKDTPRNGEIWKKLEKHQNFQLFQQECDIHQRLLDLGYLSNYVHTKGKSYSNSLGLFKSNFQTFEREGFKRWFESFLEVLRVLCILHLIKYPIGSIKYDFSSKFGIDVPMFGGLDTWQVEHLERFVGDDVFSVLNKIAASDGTVHEIMEWVSNLPDMTEVQLKEQMDALDKRWEQYRVKPQQEADD